MKTYFVYIVTNKKRGTLYIGMTNNLVRRIAEHKRKLVKGFSEKYNLDKLVWYEQTNDVKTAIQREKQIKKWNRNWKIELIEDMNSQWGDLFFEIGGSNEMLESGYSLGWE